MIIKKFFIKDYRNTNSSKVRFQYGLVAGVFGIITNLVLFVLKILVGVMGASITIIADAMNSLSDVGTSAVVILGFKLSSKPADSEHPFGHERYEQILALIIAVLVLSIGILIAKSSVEKIISPNITTVSVYTYIVLCFAILVKFGQMFFYKDFAKSIKSTALKASSIDSRNDIISTFAVLVATIVIHIFGNMSFSLDGVFGLFVSIFIILSSLNLMRETISPLLGQMPDKKFVKKIKNKILNYEGVLGIHDFSFHSYGANNFFVTVHVEVSSKIDVMKSHDMIDNIERDFKESNINLTIHMDPIETENEEVNFHKEKVKIILNNFNKKLDFHDFRLVSGETHTNILFDVVVPFNQEVSLQEIKQELEDKYKCEDKKYFFIIDLDRI